MPALIDLTGKRFGRLIVTARGEDYTQRNGKPLARWHCTCDCGTERLVLGGALRSGQTMSCGCWNRDIHTKHGGTRRKTTYKSWESARSRCFNTRDKAYPDYGGRGITMHPEWASEYAAFLRDMGERPEGYTLERKDFNGNYEPGNCEWIPKSRQQRNRRSVYMIEHGGRTLALAEWAREWGCAYETLRHQYVYYKTPFAQLAERFGKRAA